MQNLKYLKQVINTKNDLEIELNDYALKHNEIIQRRFALSLFEFFNGGHYISEEDIEKTESGFSVSKKKYPKLNPNKR